MKTILFTYESPVGIFWIRPEPADRVRLGVDKQQLRSYGSATLAARAVRERTTGWEAWDSLEGVAAPARLQSWKRPAREKTKRAS